MLYHSSNFCISVTINHISWSGFSVVWKIILQWLRFCFSTDYVIG